MLAVLKGIYQVFRCVREFVLSLFFILFVMICFALVNLMQSEPTSSKPPLQFDKGALRLNLDGYLADNHDEFNDFHRLIQSELGASSEPLKLSVFDVVRVIKKAKNDDNITGLVLDLSYFEGGDLASLHFIGDEIERFKQSKKPVLAIGDYYSQSQYFLASFADRIYLNKAGFIDLHGMNYSPLYFKSLLEKIDAVPHIFRVGTYKSAVEPFLRDNMSPEARQNAQLWLTQLWDNFSHKIAQNRNIPTKQVLPNIQQYLREYKQAGGDDAQYALERQLITQLVTPSQLADILRETFGENAEGDYNSIDFFEYADTLPDRFNVESANKIAVINVEGEIIFGESDQYSAGSDSIVALLRQARLDKDIKGIILRVNSPGGSAIASELIRQEIEAIQQSGKPVVTSMGGMAASGGYWIAAHSDKIIASPSTLTGSIGIFGLAISFEQTAKNLGISQDGVMTSPLANNVGLKPISKEQGEVIQISIENGYERFLTLVSQGRNMTKAEVDKVAQGQVWTGESAFKHGLVDQLGDFNDAHQILQDLINQRNKEAGKEEVTYFATQWLIEQDQDLISQILRDLKLQLKVGLADFLNIPMAKQLRQPFGLLTKFNDPKQTYLYCLNCSSIQ